MPRIAVTLIVLLLIAGTAVAFTVTEKLKLEHSPLTAPRFTRQFSPVCNCETDKARLEIRFRHAERVDAAVVDSGGSAVRTLARNERVRKGDHTFVWNGRDDAGAVVPDGVYRLRLGLGGDGRTIVVPTSIRVDTIPPTVALIRARPRVISPRAGGTPRQTKVVFRSSERGRPELLVDSERAVLGRNRGRGKASLNWNGSVGGEVVPAGTYGVVVRVRDLAGNISQPTRSARVKVRS